MLSGLSSPGPSTAPHSGQCPGNMYLQTGLTRATIVTSLALPCIVIRSQHLGLVLSRCVKHNNKCLQMSYHKYTNVIQCCKGIKHYCLSRGGIFFGLNCSFLILVCKITRVVSASRQAKLRQFAIFVTLYLCDWTLDTRWPSIAEKAGMEFSAGGIRQFLHLQKC